VNAESNVATKLSALGKYSLIASLGQGGMAKVYLALMAGPGGFNKLLVVKALREDVHQGSDDFVQMFLDEARLAARLNHPNIVQTYEVGESDGRYFIAMEYLEGQALRTVQRRLATGIPIDEELRIVAQTARGLDYAHDLKGFSGEPLGVVHRDVSPQNVFLTYDGQVKLLDFGIAKTQGAEHLTKVGVIKGKIDYIAPEQVRGDRIDRRADIFPLGVMLWEAVTGARFAGGNKVADVTKIHARVTGSERKLEEVVPDLHEELRRIINKAIALEPDHRYATAAQLADDLEHYLEAEGKKPTAKSLSDLVTPLFESERAKMRVLIDQQIQVAQRRGMRLGDTTGSLPQFGRTTGTHSGIKATSGAQIDLTESGYLDLSGEENLPALEGSAPSSYSNPTAVSQVGSPGMPTARRGVPRLVVLGVLAASVALALFLALRADPETHSRSASATEPATTNSTPPAPATEPAAATPTAPAEPATQPAPVADVAAPARETVRIHIDVSPATALVTLDGSRLPKVPFTAELVKDGTMHHIHASLAGYETQKIMLPFDAPRDMHIVLEAKSTRGRKRASVAVAAPPTATEPSAPPVAPPEPKKASGDYAPGTDLNVAKPRVRTGIDVNDPYAN
jgi:serine/threonine-protein kinase